MLYQLYDLTNNLIQYPIIIITIFINLDVDSQIEALDVNVINGKSFLTAFL